MSRMLKSTKRILTGIVAAAMIVTAIPTYAFAAELPSEVSEEGDVVLTAQPAEETVVTEEPASGENAALVEDTSAGDTLEEADGTKDTLEEEPGEVISEEEKTDPEATAVEEQPAQEEAGDELLETEESEEETEDELLGEEKKKDVPEFMKYYYDSTQKTFSLHILPNEKLDSYSYELKALDANNNVVGVNETSSAEGETVDAQIIMWHLNGTTAPKKIRVTLSGFTENSENVKKDLNCADGEYFEFDLTTGNCFNATTISGSWYTSETDKGAWTIDSDGVLTIQSQSTQARNSSKMLQINYSSSEKWKEFDPGWAGYLAHTCDLSRVNKVIYSGAFAAPSNTFVGYNGKPNVTEFDLTGLAMAGTDCDDMNHLFASCGKLTTIKWPNSLDTSHVRHMYGMFGGCSSLTSVDLSKLDTSSVEIMGNMFTGCSALTELDLSRFNMASIRTDDPNNEGTGDMLSGCTKLAKVIPPSALADGATIALPGTGWNQVILGKATTSTQINSTNLYGSIFAKAANIAKATINIPAEGCTVNVFEGDSPDQVKLDPGKNDYNVVKGTSLSLTVETLTGYKAVVKVGSKVITLGEDRKYLLGPINAATTVTVTTSLKPVRVTTDFDSNLFKLALTGVDKDPSSGLFTKSTPTDIKVTVSGASNKVDLKGYTLNAAYNDKWTNPDTPVWKEVSVANNSFTITKDIVESAMKAEKDIEIELTSGIRDYPLTVAPISGIRWKYYDSENKTFCAISTDTSDPTLVEYGSEMFVVPVYEDQKNSVKTVKANSTVLKATEKELEISGQTESKKIMGYMIPSSATKLAPTVQNPEVKLTATSEEMVPFTFVGSYCDLKPTTAGIKYETKLDDYSTVAKLPSNKDKVDFVASTEGAYALTALKVGETPITPVPAGKLNKTKNGFDYAFSLTKEQLSGSSPAKVTATATEVTRKLEVTTDSGVKDVKVKANGVYISGSESEGIFTYTVDPFTPVTVIASLEDNFAFGSITLDDAEQKNSLKNGTVVFTALGNSLTKVNFTTTGLALLQTALFQSSPDARKWTTRKDNETVNLPSSTAEYMMQVLVGSTDEVITLGGDASKLPDGFASIHKPDEEDPHTYVVINPSNAGNVSKVTVPVEFTFGEKTVTKKLTFNVPTANITDISLAGFKKTGTEPNVKYTIEQAAGTSVKYKLTAKPANADINKIRVEKTGSAKFRSIFEFDKGTPVVTVSTFSGADLANEVCNFEITAGGPGGKKYLFEVTPKAKKDVKLSAPVVTVTGTNDNSITLNLSVPAKDQGYKNLWFAYYAEAKGTVASGMKARVPENGYKYEPVTDTQKTFTDKLQVGGDPGKGCAQNYEVHAVLIQTTDGKEPSTEKTNYNYEGAEKKLSASTKNPYYETSLSLNKITTTITIGAKDVLVATPKYSSNTTYTRVGNMVFVDSNGAMTNCAEFIYSSSDGEIVLNKTDNKMVPGKYTLYVFPEGNYSYVKPAALPLTFVAPMNSFHIEASTDTLYKTEKSTASVKVSALYDEYVDCNGNYWKPANVNVTWEYDSTNSALKDKISGKNGTFTVAKDYVLDPLPENNEFSVKAYAADGSSESNELTFTVTSEMTVVPAGMSIGDIEGSPDKKPQPVLSNALDGKEFKLFDADGKPIDPGNTTITVTPAKGMRIFFDPGEGSEPDKWECILYSAGTYNVKVTANDGSKKTLSMNFSVKEAENEGYDVSVVTLDSSGDEDERTFTGPEMELDKRSIIMSVIVSPKTSTGAEFVKSSKVTIKPLGTTTEVKGKIFDGVVLKPGEGDNEVRFSVTTADGKIKNAEYTVKMPAEEEKKLVPAKDYKVLSFCKADQTLEFEIDKTTDLGESWNVFFVPSESMYSNEKTSFNAEHIAYRLTNGEASKQSGSEKDKISLVVKDTTNTYKGTYELYASVWKTGKNDKNETVPTVAVTKPVKVKVIVNEPKKPTASFKTSTFTMKAKLSDPAESVKIRFSKATNVSDVGYARVYNNNSNGKINDFTSYFTATPGKDDEGHYIELKMTNQIVSGESNITGWIRYSITGEDGVTKIEIYEKVTIKLEGTVPLITVDCVSGVSPQEVAFVKGIKKNGQDIVPTLTDDIVLKVSTKLGEYEEINVRWTYDPAEMGTAAVYNPATKQFTIPKEVAQEAFFTGKNITIVVEKLLPG